MLLASGSPLPLAHHLGLCVLTVHSILQPLPRVGSSGGQRWGGPTSFAVDIATGGWERTHARREPRLSIKSYIRKLLLVCAVENTAMSFTTIKKLKSGKCC